MKIADAGKCPDVRYLGILVLSEIRNPLGAVVGFAAMTHDQSKQRRLLDDLERLLFQTRPFGFGIMSADPPKKVENRKLWEEIGRLIPAKNEGEDSIVFEVRPAWYEPFPDGLACVRWWGDTETVRRFEGWAGRAGSVLVDEGVLPDDTTIVERQTGSMSVRIAVPDPLLRDGQPFLLVKHLAITLKKMHPDRVRTLRFDRSVVQPSVENGELSDHVIESFAFEGFPPFGGLATEAFRALCNLRGEPRLDVDVDARTVILDGDRYVLPEKTFLVFEAIFSGGGEVVSRTQMQFRHELLSHDQHLDRQVDDLKGEYPKLYETIDRVPKKGFRIFKHYLE